MISMLRITFPLFFIILGSLAAFAQPSPVPSTASLLPMVADTAWETIPRAVGVQCVEAGMDGNGDLLCAFMVRDSARFGSTSITPARSDAEFGVAKFRSDGTPLWIRPTGFPRWQTIGFDADQEGNSFALYSAGKIGRRGKMKIGDSVIEGDGGVALAKYSPSGDLLWAIWLSGDIEATDVTADGSGGAIVTGMRINYYSPYGPATMKFPGSTRVENEQASVVISVAPDGSLRWSRMATSRKGNMAHHAAVAPNGDIIITGMFLDRNHRNHADTSHLDTLRMESGSLAGAGCYMARYRNNGDLVWARCITSGRVTLRGEDAAFDSTGNILLTGTVDGRSSDYTLWDTLGIGMPIRTHGGHDIFVAKVSGDGRFLWGDVLGGRKRDDAGHIHAAPDGGVFLTGTLRGYARFGLRRYYAQGKSAAFVARYDSNGTHGWFRFYDPRGTATSPLGGRSTSEIGSQLDRQGRLWVMGVFSGVMNVDSITLGTEVPVGIRHSHSTAQNTFAIRLVPGSHIALEPVWTKIDAGLPYNLSEYSAPDVNALAVFGGQIYAGLAPGDARDWLDNAGTGVYSSTNRGRSWTRNTGGDRPEDSLRYGVQRFATLGDSLYTVTGAYTHASTRHTKAMVMNRNTPGEWSWLKRSDDPDLSSLSTVDGVLYGMSRIFPAYGILRWNPGTREWQAMDITGMENAMVETVTGFGDVLVASTGDPQGLYRSSNRGASWTVVDSTPPESTPGIFKGANDLAVVGRSIYLAAPAGFSNQYASSVFRSDDSGRTWRPFADGLPFIKHKLSDSIIVPIDVFYVKDSVLFAGCERGIWMLAPGSAQWVSITDDLQHCRVNAIVADDAYLYAALSYCGMWRRPLGSILKGIALEDEDEDERDEKEEEDPAPRPEAPDFHLTVIPNPVTASARIRFILPATGETRVSLYDAAGSLIRVLAGSVMAEGEQELFLDGTDLLSGTYFVRVETSEGSASTAMIYQR